jgi:hypothetical protein
LLSEDFRSDSGSAAHRHPGFWTALSHISKYIPVCDKMNFDLDIRSNRLQKEHLKLREDARKKREQELISRANCKKRDDEQRELNMKRKLQEEEDEIERQEREEEEAQLTGGIKYKQMLAVVGIEGEDDKAVLPESALESLTAQDSFGKGAAVFQLTLTLNGKHDLSCYSVDLKRHFTWS